MIIEWFVPSNLFVQFGPRDSKSSRKLVIFIAHSLLFKYLPGFLRSPLQHLVREGVKPGRIILRFSFRIRLTNAHGRIKTLSSIRKRMPSTSSLAGARSYWKNWFTKKSAKQWYHLCQFAITSFFLWQYGPMPERAAYTIGTPFQDVLKLDSHGPAKTQATKLEWWPISSVPSKIQCLANGADCMSWRGQCRRQTSRPLRQRYAFFCLARLTKSMWAEMLDDVCSSSQKHDPVE